DLTATWIESSESRATTSSTTVSLSSEWMSLTVATAIAARLALPEWRFNTTNGRRRLARIGRAGGDPASVWCLGHLRASLRLGPVADAAARVPGQLLGLGSGCPAAGAELSSPRLRFPRLRKFGQAPPSRVLDRRAGRPDRGDLAAPRYQRDGSRRPRLRRHRRAGTARANRGAEAGGAGERHRPADRGALCRAGATAAHPARARGAARWSPACTPRHRADVQPQPLIGLLERPSTYGR